jgi:hypothetical protein
MASIKAIRDGLRDLLSGGATLATELGEDLITEDGDTLIPEGTGVNLGLYVHDTIPDNVYVPAAIVGMPSSVRYDFSFRTPVSRYLFPIRVIAGRVMENQGQDLIDDLASPDGALSVRAAIDGDPGLGGAAHSTRVTEARDFGVYEVAGVPYIGCEFEIEVIA